MDQAREPYLVADVTPLEDEVGDEARAERLAASAIRRFVRYLELMRAREGETVEALDSLELPFDVKLVRGIEERTVRVGGEAAATGEA